jgi:hypothetical protein
MKQSTLLFMQPDGSATSFSQHARKQIQALVQNLLVDIFGPQSYQAAVQQYYRARVLARMGYVHEACEIMAGVVPRLEAVYGPEGSMTITAMLELTKLHLGAHDTSKDTENLISDALRRIKILEDTADDDQVRRSGFVHLRMGCLRVSGRLQVMRGNLELAKMRFAHAVSTGTRSMDEHAPAVKLAKADLRTVEAMIAASEARSEGQHTTSQTDDLLAKLNARLDETQDGAVDARWIERHLSKDLKRLTLN